MTASWQRNRIFAATVALLIGAAMAAVSSPNRATAEGIHRPPNFLPLPRPTVVSVERIASLAPSRTGAVNRIIRAEAGETAVKPAPDVPLAALGGADAPGSPVRSAGQGNGEGFPGLDLVKQESAGSGIYANTGGGLEPPDQALCVGNGYVMEGVNQAFRIYNTRGLPLTPALLLAQFFDQLPNTLLGATSFLSDPKCIYDAATKRFFATSLEVDQANFGVFTRAHNLVAVSKTSDPTKEWYVYSFDVTDDGQAGTPLHATCPCIGDQPLIGADANGFYISTNEFSDGEIVPVPLPPVLFDGLNTAFSLPDFRNGQAQLYAISKRTLIHGSSGIVWQHDTAGDPLPAEDVGTLGALWSSLQPSFSPPADATPAVPGGVEYFMSQLDFAKTGDNRVAVWALTNTASLDSPSPDLHLLHTVIQTRDPKDTYTYASSASQKVGPHPMGEGCLPDPCGVEKLSANDDRMNQVMLANGHLWSGVNTLLPPIDEAGTGQEADPRTGIMYFDVRPSVKDGNLTATMIRDGYVNVPRQSVLFPSIAASPKGPVVIGFTLSGVDHYPSAAWARLDGLGASQAPVVHISGKGVAPEDGFTGYCAAGLILPLSNLGGQCSDEKSRWGDYSAAVVDESGCLWTAVEMITGLRRDAIAGNWSTFITRIAADGCAAPKLTPKDVIGQPLLDPCLPLFAAEAGTDDIEGLGINRGQNPQLDLVGGDVRLSKDGKFLATTLTLKGLSKDMPSPAGLGNFYYMYFSLGEKDYYSEASVDPTGAVTYADGELTSTGRSRRASDDTGSFTEGPNGTVVVNIPLSAVGSPKRGDLVKQPYSETRVFFGVPSNADPVGVGGLVLAEDTGGPDNDYKIGQVCVASKPVHKPPLPKPRLPRVKGRHLAATGVHDTAALQLGLILMGLAAAVGYRVRRTG